MRLEEDEEESYGILTIMRSKQKAHSAGEKEKSGQTKRSTENGKNELCYFAKKVLTLCAKC
jgi:hypothetical protein